MNANDDQVVADQAMQDDGGELFFQDVDELQKHNINAADIAKLKLAGICTVKGVAMATRKNLCNIKGISEAKMEKMKEAAAKMLDNGFITALEFSVRRQNIFQIGTGSVELNKLLGGGMESMAITEIFGEFRTGKTQICHTLCITTQLPAELGGAGGKVAYIDTEGTFSGGITRPDRLAAIADRFNLDRNAVLENVMFARAFNSEHQMDLINMCAAKFAEERGIYRLLIIDSVMAMFRVDFCGRGELADRQQKLGQMLSRLMKLAEEFNIAVVITNQMTADPGAGMTFVPDPKKPIGGNIIAHASTTRLYLRKGRGETRVCKIYDSPNLPESEAMFAITEGGITDGKD